MQQTKAETPFARFLLWMSQRRVNSAATGLDKSIQRVYHEIDKIHDRSNSLSVVHTLDPISEEEYFNNLIETISLSCNRTQAEGTFEYSSHLLFWGYDHKFMEREETFQAIRDSMFVRRQNCQSCDYKSLSEVPSTILFVEQTDRYDNLTKLENLAMEHETCIKIIKLPSKIDKGAIIIPPTNISLWDQNRQSVYLSEKDNTIYRNDLYVENLQSFELHFRLFALYWDYDRLSKRVAEVNKK